jgi:glycopeptide antibiotics resistance protein
MTSLARNQHSLLMLGVLAVITSLLVAAAIWKLPRARRWVAPASLAVTLLPPLAVALPLSSGAYLGRRIQYHPLRTISAELSPPTLTGMFNLVANASMLVPFGIAVYVTTRRTVHVLTLAVAASLAVETVQWLSARRIADVDDVIMNALGGLLGAGLGLLAVSVREHHRQDLIASSPHRENAAASSGND